MIDKYKAFEAKGKKRPEIGFYAMGDMDSTFPISAIQKVFLENSIGEIVDINDHTHPFNNNKLKYLLKFENAPEEFLNNEGGWRFGRLKIWAKSKQDLKSIITGKLFDL